MLSALSLFRPDAVIIDIGLPGVSGYAIAQAIRNSFTEIRKPLLIAITGLSKETPDLLVAEQVGFDHFLLKPCKPDEFDPTAEQQPEHFFPAALTRGARESSGAPPRGAPIL